MRRIVNKLFNACPFDFTTFAVSGKVGIPLTGITTPVRWLLLLQLIVLNRSAIVVLSKFLVAFLCCNCGVFLIFCWSLGFCHRTESDLFLFLFICISISWHVLLLAGQPKVSNGTYIYVLRSTSINS